LTCVRSIMMMMVEEEEEEEGFSKINCGKVALYLR
jgi:hypothetical protein